MNKWQERFSQKVEVIRIASRDRFEKAVIDNVLPIFDEFSDFTKTRGLQASAPAPTSGMRTFKFAITENAYVLMTVRLSGLESCEANAEFFVPSDKNRDALCDHVPFPDLNPNWVRLFFEKALDQFVDAYLEALGSKAGRKQELVTA